MLERRCPPIQQFQHARKLIFRMNETAYGDSCGGSIEESEKILGFEYLNSEGGECMKTRKLFLQFDLDGAVETNTIH